jgi:hypothetical protein
MQAATEAAAAAKHVITSKKYSLFPNYRGLFYWRMKQPEVIFDV